MDRKTCIAVACALAAHAMVLLLWPAHRAEVPSLVKIAESPPATTPEPIPVAVEFISLEPVKLAPSRDQVPEGHMTEVRSSRARRATGDTRAPTPPETRAHRPEPGTKSTLRMRGLDPMGPIDPRRVSSLQAAIESAAAYVPDQAARSDLLGATEGGRPESSPWRPSGHGTMRAKGEPYKATIARDGTIQFEDRPNVQLDGIKTMPGSLIPSIAGHFDVTDAVMKSMGEVLYPYRKLKLMDESREMRAGMAMRSKEESLHAALATYPGRLRKLWRDPQYSLAERKRLLFALWDECAESGTHQVLATAQSVRASTVAFIQHVLPADAAEAYTKGELAELNAERQSAELFSPYAEK